MGPPVGDQLGHELARLRLLFAEGKKLKVDDFLKVFSLPAGGDLK